MTAQTSSPREKPVTGDDFDLNVFLITPKFWTKNNDKRKSSLILWTPISCPNSPFVLVPCLILMFSLHQKTATMTKPSAHRSIKEQKCEIKDHQKIRTKILPTKPPQFSVCFTSD